MIVLNHEERVKPPFVFVDKLIKEGKTYIVFRCQICESNYPALGRKCYTTLYTTFAKHQACLCSVGGFRKLTKEERDIYFKTIVNNKGYNYLSSIIGETVKNSTATLSCPVCNNVFTVKGLSITSDHFGCQRCRLVNMVNNNKERGEATLQEQWEGLTKSYRQMFEHFHSIVPVGTSSISGFKFYCKKCSFLDGEVFGFYIGFSNAYAGNIPCYCASTLKSFRYLYWLYKKRAEQEIGLNSILLNDKKPYKLSCRNHGNFSLTYTQFRENRYLCPKCARSAYREDLTGYLYIIAVEHNGEHFGTGFGITNHPSDRIKTHLANFEKLKTKTITRVLLFRGDGDVCKLVEYDLLKLFANGSLDLDGFRREFSTHIYLDLVKSICANGQLGLTLVCEVGLEGEGCLSGQRREVVKMLKQKLDTR